MSDVVVVGGGVIGLAIAFELQRRGRRVVVLDAGEPGAASRVAAGMLAPVSEAEETDRELLGLALESRDRWPAFAADVEAAGGRGCGYRTEGTVWVAVTRDDEVQIEHLEETLRRRSLDARRLESREVLEREPRLSGRVLGGLQVDGDRQVDPRGVLEALEAAVIRLGGRVRHGVRAVSLETRGGSVSGVIERAGNGDERRRPADTVVWAAGAWSGRGVRPVKGQIVRLRGCRVIDHVIRHPEVYLVPRRDGDLLVGGTMEEMGFDVSVTAGAVHDLLRRARRIVPEVDEMVLAEVGVGLRPMTRDGRPVIGAARPGGVFQAFGHGRNGVLLAPATAHHLAEQITAGTRAAALDPFAPGRSRGRSAGVEA